MVPSKKKKSATLKNQMAQARAPVTASVEALRLYRAILRTTRLFQFPNESGDMMSDVLATSARGEFEAARFERDPTVVAQAIVTGWDCVHQIREQHAQKLDEIRAGGGGGAGGGGAGSGIVHPDGSSSSSSSS